MCSVEVSGRICCVNLPLSVYTVLKDLRLLRCWIRELPKPPLPPLEVTLERYLSCLEAVVSKNQFDETKKIVNDFAKGDGIALHRLVEKLAQEKENWATSVWLPEMYLLNRLPLPVNQSAFFLFPRQNFKTFRDQILFSAQLLHFALEFQRLIETETLDQDFSRAVHVKRSPLCMDTYSNFFNSYRRPGVEIDYQLNNKRDPKYHKSVVVIHRKQFYFLDLSSDPSIDSIATALNKIRTSSTTDENTPVGALTTQPRDKWAHHYELLRKDNTAHMEALERCLLVLCLNESTPPSKQGLSRTDQCEDLLHGKGVNSCNRWYDKTLQVMVGVDGVTGVVMEHSQSEGITLLRFMEDFLARQAKNGVHNVDWSAAPCPFERMQWKLSPTLTQAIVLAREDVQKLVDDVDLYVLHFKDFGKALPKSKKISPDVFVQLALQLTYYKVHRKLVTTYESASLRRFRLGRADNIRAATKQALQWVEAMCDEHQETQEQKHELFREAVEAQTAILKYTITGNGPDNHMLAMREIAKKIQLKTRLFNDKSHQTFWNFQLSTSQLPNDSNIIVGYGAVVPDGYGCAYTINENDIVFSVASFDSSSATSSDFFALSLECSLNQMRELCNLGAKAQ
ncbi:choline O-acetyltransferase [Galendromus occidentalis]|uniref:Choline O-acetyltransferase n=1 Tax=Galendromus occidentalis TaxID=34638 RepID=A0AAJ7PAN2_9ACAR|nr:choline O-acetyltransferase [Galendromus occidentalis]